MIVVVIDNDPIKKLPYLIIDGKRWVWKSEFLVPYSGE